LPQDPQVLLRALALHGLVSALGLLHSTVPLAAYGLLPNNDSSRLLVDVLSLGVGERWGRHRSISVVVLQFLQLHNGLLDATLGSRAGGQSVHFEGSDSCRVGLVSPSLDVNARGDR